MPQLRIKIAVFLNYFLFGIMLNSVGTVVLQTQRYFGVSQTEAAVLEAFKDLPIAIVSFLIASYITTIGYRKAMLIGLAAVSLACFSVPLFPSFMAIKVLFAITGAAFALTKISVFGTIGLVTTNEKAHISLMNFVESVFMVGILSGYLVFSLFIDDHNSASPAWFNTYYILGVLYLFALFLLSTASLDESAAKPEKDGINRASFFSMLRLLLLPVVVSFVVCAFLYVLIEQSIMSWLPTFNNKVLQIPSSLSVLMAGILAFSTALGRFLFGFVARKVHWIYSLQGCLLAAAILVLLVLPLANRQQGVSIESWRDLPFAAYAFPLIGLFLAPIYPAINSVILATLPKSQHGTMSGLIVVFSALGGSLGSLITGFIFQHYGGLSAFYFSLLPILLLAGGLLLFNHFRSRSHVNVLQNA